MSPHTASVYIHKFGIEKQDAKLLKNLKHILMTSFPRSG